MARVVRQEIVAFMDDPDGDKPNAIHSTGGARDYGFSGALIGGVTAYGWTVRAIVEAVGAEWLDRGWITLAFKRPMYPGDALEVAIDRDGALAVRRLRGSNEAALPKESAEDRSLCFEGRVGLGLAPWYEELGRPMRVRAEPRAAQLPLLTPENAPVGHDLTPMPAPLTADEARTFAREREHETLDCFFGERPRVHPAWLAEQPIRLLHHSFDYGPSIHTESRIQHLSAAWAGQDFVVSGRCKETFARKGHDYVANDCQIADATGETVVRLRHTSIFRVAKRGAL